MIDFNLRKLLSVQSERLCVARVNVKENSSSAPPMKIFVLCWKKKKMNWKIGRFNRVVV